MCLEQLNALDSRVRSLVQLLQELKRENATLKVRLSATEEQLREHEQRLKEREDQQTGMQDRIERILKELEAVEHSEEAGAEYRVDMKVSNGGPS